MRFSPGSLKPITVNVEDLLLDANNPRFAELGDDMSPVPEARLPEERVQENATHKMRDPAFDVKELRDTIKELGFLPVDRLVVRPWSGNRDGGTAKYVVVEGNRRLTAVKWLLELHEEGKETLEDNEIAALRELECLIIDSGIAPEHASVILPGLRHVSGIKEWGPYQKAKAIFGLRQGGMSPSEVAQSLGLSTRAANVSYRCFRALEQMSADEEYGELAGPKLYSYFEEALKKPVVKEWLGWSEEQECFQDRVHLAEFYSWITPHPDTDEVKLPMAIHVRELAKVLSDEDALAVFRAHDGTLTRALAKYEVDNPEDWYPKLTAAINAIKALTPDMLRNLDEETLRAVDELHRTIELALNDRRRLQQP